MTSQKNPKRILVAVLNWGLGHAARSVPLIRELQQQGAEVVIASDGQALGFLQKEIPNGRFTTLPSYNPRYSSTNRMIPTILWQVPKFLRVRNKEHEIVQKLVATHKIDGIIADCRWGCYSAEVPSLIVTHQLNLQVPNWADWLSTPLNWVNQRLLKNFDKCWVPDYADEPNLSGRLAHNQESDLAIDFIGPLSRVWRMSCHKKDIEWEVLVLLSGPEPQRCVLEQKLMKQIEEIAGNILFVRGVPGKQEIEQISRDSQHIKIVNSLTTEALAEVLASTSMVVARAGYSTIMDLLAARQKGLLIPTPGQTEQEYLAKRCMEMGLFYTVEQNQLQLRKDIPKAEQYKRGTRAGTPSKLKDAISSYLNGL
ncbi:MAG: glycosyltransferase [Bacteroidetes bacterium SW_11_45_7]|nr:MAG: glycosyltransferase [Bacteroidetes bacterium SW_11_45_7]